MFKINDSVFKRGFALFTSCAIILASIPLMSLGINLKVKADGNIGVIINGDFEDPGGTTGYSNNRTTTFHVVEEPGNTQNHVLHVSGSTEAGNGEFWQDVAVKPNTDYIWTYRMKDENGQAATHVIEVFGGSSFTNRLMTEILSSAGTTLGDQGSKGWYAKPANGTDWVTITAKFNSGDNTVVRLNDNAWFKTNRNTYIDDWKLEEATIANIINGDFENGINGYVTDGQTTKFETIVDPDDTNNHVLNFSGSTTAGSGMFWQDIIVKPNTDYIWTFRMKDENGQAATHVIEVFGGSSFTNRLMTEIMSSAGTTLGDQGSKGWYAKPDNGTDWVTITAKFNSGNNNKVRLNDNAWFKTNRNTYIDDWKLEEASVANIINGDFEDGINGYHTDGKTTKFETIVDPNDANNHVLNISGSTTAGSGMFWQDIIVKPNTDYIWTFRMKDENGQAATHVIEVYGGSSLTNRLMTEIMSSAGTQLGDQGSKGWYAKPDNGTDWVTITAKFNSGNNNKVRLNDNAWYNNNRNTYIDDWKLEETTAAGITNGDFEDGVSGFITDDKTTKFKTVVDPDDNNNHILNVSGFTSPGSGAFWQDVSVVQNTDYIWTFRMKDSGGQMVAHIVSVLGGASLDTNIIDEVVSSAGDALTEAGAEYKGWYAKPHNSTDWVVITVKFNSGSNTVIRLKDNAFYNNRNTYIDDWKLEIADDEENTGTGSLTNANFEDGTNGYMTDGKTTKFQTVADPDDSNNHILNISGNSTPGSGAFWQDVNVDANTDYVWTFRMKDSGGQNVAHIVSVLGGSSFNTSLISDVLSSAGDALMEAGAEYKGWYAKPHNSTDWVTITVKFNSGSNTVVRLKDNAFYNNRNTFIDDWKLEIADESDEETAGELINGNFEDGVNGYVTDGKTTKFQTVVDPDNSDNHILNVSGFGTPGSGAFWQDVKVDENTDYVWTFRMKDSGGQNVAHIVSVLGGSSFNTSLISDVLSSAGDALMEAGAEYKGWYAKPHNSTDWVTITVKFNSGSNTIVRLKDNAFYNNRNTYIDDWRLAIDDSIGNEPSGELTNGDFEDGVNGYITDGKTSKFKTVEDPDNSENHILNVSGFGTPGSGAFWQDVTVNENTDYTWSFRMKDTTGMAGAHIVSVLGGSSFDTSLIINVTSSVGTELAEAGAQYKGWYAKPHNGTDWVTIKVNFNSGSNTVVRLKDNAFYNNRNTFIDDWKLEVADFTVSMGDGNFINGKFEDGVNGFTTDGMTSKFDIVTEAGNNVLNVSGSSTAGKGMFWQDIMVKTDTDYELTFRMKEKSGTFQAHIVSVLGGNKFDTDLISDVSSGLGTMLELAPKERNGWYVKIPTADTWDTFKITFNSGANKVIRFRYNVYFHTRDAYIDDLELKEVYKEPLISNPGFENGVDGYKATEGLQISTVAAENESFGEKTLKMSNSGKLIKEVSVSKYTNYSWKFWIKTTDDNPLYFAVRSKSTGKIIPSTLSVQEGSPTVGNESFANERDDKLLSYHYATSNNAWSQVVVNFKTGDFKDLEFIILKDSNSDAYTDNWYLAGKFEYPEGEILNSGFEDGLDFFNYDPEIKAEVVNDSHSGNKAIRITKLAPEGREGPVTNIKNFYQTIKVKKNSYYMWTFWLKINEKLDFKNPIGATVSQNGGTYLYSKIGADENCFVDPGTDWHRLRYENSDWHQYKILIDTANAEEVKLQLIAYTMFSDFTIDDWAIEYLGEVNNSDIVTDIDFESEKSGALQLTKTPWSKTDEQAHSGRYSMKYDASASGSASTILYYLNDYGVVDTINKVDKDSKYRLSFWYKGVGNLKLADIRIYQEANKLLDDEKKAPLKQNNNYYKCENENWNYIEVIIDTKDSDRILSILNGRITGSKSFNIYIDDIKIEKIVPGVVDEIEDSKNITCSDENNMIPDGSVTSTQIGANWNDIVGVKVVDKTGANGNKSIELGANVQGAYKLKLVPYRVYKFAFSYRTDKGILPNARVGLCLSDNPQEYVEERGLINLGNTDGEWKRIAYTFCAPESGDVYLVFENSEGSIYLDDFALYFDGPISIDSYSGIMEDEKKVESSIWDQEFDFDFDWLNEDYEEIEEIIDNDKQTNSKKMRKIVKKVFIPNEKSITPIWVIIIYCVGGILLLGDGIFFVIYCIKRKNSMKG